MKNPVFIGGAGRSGTTLMRVILNAHPNLCAGPEFKLLPEICRLYSQISQWEDIQQAYSLSKEEISKNFSSFIYSFFKNFQLQSNAQRFIEKTPHNVLVMKELGEIFPQARFIHMVRDGRDVANSLVKMDWLDMMGRPVWYVSNIENAIRYWNQVVNEGLKAEDIPQLKDRIKIIFYEDLIMEPKKTLGDILDFIGENWVDEVLDYTNAKRSNEPTESSTHQISQNIYTTSIGKWETEMTEEDKEKVKKIGSELLMRLGYEEDFDW